ncbi:MAG: hypothetical protein MIO92_11560, partial [Methanosarcinaceae archaeon]|nr:hypothetical protein [Methanosarcinaceae archaeon]
DLEAPLAAGFVDQLRKKSFGAARRIKRQEAAARNAKAAVFFRTICMITRESNISTAVTQQPTVLGWRLPAAGFFVYSMLRRVNQCNGQI